MVLSIKSRAGYNFFIFLKYPNTMTKALNILLIEDDEIEVMKFNRVLSKKQLYKLLRQIMVKKPLQY
jgi:hypothetical protein